MVEPFRGIAWLLSVFLLLNFSGTVAVGYLCRDSAIIDSILAVLAGVFLVSFGIFGIILAVKLRPAKKLFQKQCDEIGDVVGVLNALDAGVFTLDASLGFGTHFSASLVRLLGRPITPGADFQTLYGDLAGAEELELAVMYLRLLSAGRVKEGLIQDANPMREIPVKTERGTRYLKFSFRRLERSGQAYSLFGVVTDVTEEVRLRAEIASTRREATEQWNTMLQLVQSQPQTLMTFINETTAGLMEIHDRLRSASGAGLSDYRTMISLMFRQAHSIKGNANTIGLGFVAKEAHALENVMDRIRGRDTYTPEELAELEQTVLAMFEHLGWLRKTVVQCNAAPVQANVAGDDGAGAQEMTRPAPVAPYMEFQNHVLELMQRIAEAQQKKVQGSVRLAALQNLSEEKCSALRTIVSQLVRNAVVHGIEDPAERLQKGKSEKGRVAVELENTVAGGPVYAITVRDDGWGLSAERIRRAMLERGYKTDDELASLTDQQVVMEIFRPGFSTAERVDEHAGRGVGLDLVRDTAKSIGGHLNLKTKAGLFTEISVVFTA